LENYYYILINLVVFVPVLLLSFDKKVAFWKKRRALFKSIVVVGTLFILWDITFTYMGIWGFNNKYLLGISIINLPLEELLFFITIPYASLFTYEVCRAYFHQEWITRFSYPFLIVFMLLALVLLLNGAKLWYTGSIGVLSVSTLLFFFVKRPKWFGHFAIAFLLILIPFFILNGILTGSAIEQEIVWYNNSENLNIRIGTIPVEDFFYGFNLLLWNCFFFEKFRKVDFSKNL